MSKIKDQIEIEQRQDAEEKIVLAEMELNEDEAMEREHDREVEKDERAVERDLERLSDDFGNAGYY